MGATEIYLRQKYVEDGWTAKQIGDEVGLSKTHVLRLMRKFGIGRRKPPGRKIVDGYVLLLRPGHPHADSLGYVREHRLVMEQVLGRYLEPTEIVHHRNENRGDNSPDNLILKVSNSEHRREHSSPEHMRAMQAKGREAARIKKLHLIANPPPCACGCGKPVNWRMESPNTKLPKYLHGHGRVDKKRAGFAQWLAEHANTKCACGCDKVVQLTYDHYKHKKTVPQYYHGHNNRRK